MAILATLPNPNLFSTLPSTPPSKPPPPLPPPPKSPFQSPNAHHLSNPKPPKTHLKPRLQDLPTSLQVLQTSPRRRHLLQRRLLRRRRRFRHYLDINTVYYMAPYATMILAVPALLLEGVGVVQWFQSHTSILSALVIIFGSGVLAFCLNFSIFYVIHSTTAVTFNVAGNLKVAVAVTCSWMIFRNPISAMNAFGCGVTLVGCTFYGYVRHLLSQQPPPVTTTSTPHSPRSLKELVPLVNDKLDDKL